MAASGAGAPGDRPPGDEPLGGKAKKGDPRDVSKEVIPELSPEELLKHGVCPVVKPLAKQKQTSNKSRHHLRMYEEFDMCPEIRKRHVSRPQRGMTAAPDDQVPGAATCGGPTSGGPVLSGPASGKAPPAAPRRKKSQRYVTESDDSEMDSDASDCDHYLYRPLEDYHADLHSDSSDDEPKLSNVGK